MEERRQGGGRDRRKPAAKAPAQRPAQAAGQAPYTAPALEKGLDILELLADAGEGLSQNQVAARLGRSVGEIFRMLEVLERRGWLYPVRGERHLPAVDADVRACPPPAADQAARRRSRCR